MASTSNSSSSTAAWPPSRPSKRSKMRNGSFIIPSTGERSRRQFTLRNSSSLSSGRGSGYQTPAPDETTGERIWNTVHNARARIIAVWSWLCSDSGHEVLKCTLAYLLGSIATFSPIVSDFIGHRDGKHVVATLTVYFHPARTMGSMLEAVLIAIFAVAYAELICIASMGATIASRASLGTAAPAHVAVLLLSIGGGLGLIGWYKQRMNQPLVNVASTLASVAIISVLTKEESIQDGYFSGDKILQMFKMLFVGISFTVAVNLLVWRVSARKILRRSMVTAAICISDRLSLITSGFLNGTQDEVNSPEYAQVRRDYTSAYALMTKSLREAKLEHYFMGREKVYKLDKRLAKSLEGLHQAVGGLRSALNTQFTLLEEGFGTSAQGTGPESPGSSPQSPQLSRSMSTFMNDARERLAVIEEDEDEPRGIPFTLSDQSLDKSPMFRVPSDIFSLFIALLGPSTKSLVYTLSETLRESASGEEPNEEIIVNDQLRDSLRDALNLYNNARGNALHELYRSIELGRSRSEKIQADIEEVAAACGHFSFSLQAVAEEMDSYLDVLEDLKHTAENHARSWEWLKFWKNWGSSKANNQPHCDPECDSLLPRKSAIKGLKKSGLPRGIPESMKKRRDSFHWNAAPQSSTVLRTASQKLLQILRFVSREDVMFGIKVGIGAVIWAQFAFIPATRPMYQHWRGEWGLLSYMIVVGMTTGASNTTGTARFLGTMLGACCACASWIASQGNPYVLAIFGWFMALWNFYLILIVKNGPLGRISLLAYNVIVLYAYSLSQDVDDDDDDEGGQTPLIFDIAYHRVVSVTLGIVWGILICRLLWPISGRRKFREGLAVLYLQLGLIWKRGPLGTLLESNNTLDYMREGEQAALQRYAFKLETLCASAASEFELRGPFPHEAYGRIMHSTKHVLDGFYAMRLITERRLVLSNGERQLLEFTTAERRQLCQRICHVFQVLASCIMLEYPLTDAIPSIDNNKDQLLGKIYKFRKDHMEEELDGPDAITMAAGLDGVLSMAGEKDYALLYAYTLVTAQVATELKKVRAEIEGLFGVLNTNELLLE